MPKLFDMLSDGSDKKELQQIQSQRPDKKIYEPRLLAVDRPAHVQEARHAEQLSVFAPPTAIVIPDFVAFDLETTGLDPKNDRIIEIGAVKIIKGVETESFSTLVNPGIAIPQHITELTGIATADLADAPPLSQVLQSVFAFIGGLPLCGHQIDFDVNFLNEARRLVGLDKLANRQLDTAVLSRIALPGQRQYNLSKVAAALSVDLTDAHRALHDARASAHVAVALIPKLLEIKVATRALMARFAPASVVRSILSDSIKVPQLKEFANREPAKRPSGNFPRMVYPDTIEQVPTESIDRIFGTGGTLSQIIPAFQSRTSQIDMARSVAEVLSGEQYLVAEAGTGTGKTLAYLIPSALFALANNCRVIISTHTRNLQDQLLNKDLVFAQKATSDKLRFTSLKGRTNYLCRKRWGQLINGELGNLSTRERAGLLPLIRWAEETDTGDIESQNQFNRKWFGRIWNLVAAESHNCSGKRCSTFSTCFLQQARQRALTSHIVVINHALFYSELCAETSFLGALGPVIFDEAHHLESSGHQHLRTEIDTKRLDLYVDFLQNALKDFAGYLGDSRWVAQHDHFKRMVKQMRAATTAFCLAVDQWARTQPQDKGADFQFAIRDNPLSSIAVCANLELCLDEMQDICRSMESILEEATEEQAKVHAEMVSTISDKTSQLKADYKYLKGAETEGHVFWVEGNHIKEWIKLCGVPLDIGDVLKPVWQRLDGACVCTSATLSVDKSFSYFCDHIGLSGAGQPIINTIVESPFVATQSKCCTVTSAPELDAPDYPAFIAHTIEQLHTTFKKNILVLFTANAMLEAVWKILRDSKELKGENLFAQHQAANRHGLLEQFSACRGGVLLGADSFWEGIDAPGEACEIVIIARLPFSVPTHPVGAAIAERVVTNGGDGFMDYAMPEALLRFRQGIGRLIRSTTDRGVLVVLDKRIATKGYGKKFARSVGSPVIGCADSVALTEEMQLFFSGVVVESEAVVVREDEGVRYVPLEDI